jgi:hypothetical protein
MYDDSVGVGALRGREWGGRGRRGREWGGRGRRGRECLCMLFAVYALHSVWYAAVALYLLASLSDSMWERAADAVAYGVESGMWDASGDESGTAVRVGVNSQNGNATI